MRKTRSYRQYATAGLMLISVLLLGIFDASGHVISSIEPSFAPTEVLLERQASTKEATAFYEDRYSADEVTHLTKLAFSTISKLNWLNAYDALLIVKLHAQSKKYDEFNTTRRLPHLLQIPTDSNEPLKA